MVKSILVLCDQSPIGKNSAIESIRLASGLISLGDIECKVVFTGDSVFLFSKEFNPEALNMDSNADIFRLMELSDLDILLVKDAIQDRGFEQSDLIDYEKLRIINKNELGKLIIDSDATFRF